MRLQACPDEGQLSAHLIGKLHGAEAERLDLHLSDCDSCSQRARSLAPSDPLMAALSSGADTAAGAAAAELDESMLSQIISRAQSLPAARDTTVDCDTSRGTGGAGVAEVDLSFLSPPREQDEIGRLANYRILELLGAGGMGIVFRAEDLALQRHVALKAMRPELTSTKTARERFVREARAAAAIDHENIVTIYQVDERGSIPFLAMRFLRGESLAERLRRSGRMSIEDVLRIGRGVASGLAAAHKRKLIHRDIKPDNIWLERRAGAPAGAPGAAEALTSERGVAEATECVKIVDFGLARAEGDIDLTRAGAVMGTPRYMSPEQARGDVADHRSDLFSLGVVLHHLIAGKGPFDRGSLTATLFAVTHDAPAKLQSVRDDVPEALAALIVKLLEKSPERRPQSASAVVDAIVEIERGRVALAAAPRRVPKRRSSLSEFAGKRLMAGVAALALLAALLGIVLLIRTPQGMLRIEVNDPSVDVLVDGETIEIRDKAWEGKQAAREHRLALRLNGTEIPFSGASPTFLAGKGRVSVYLGETRLQAQRFIVSRNGTTVLRIEVSPDDAPDKGRLEPQLLSRIEHGEAKGKQLDFAILSPDGARIARGMASSMVMFETDSRRPVALPREMLSAVALDYNADGRRFATGHPDGTVRVWSSDTLKPLGPPFQAGDARVPWVSLSDDGSRLLAVSAGKPQALQAWDVDTRERIVEPFALDVASSFAGPLIAATPDGGLLAVVDTTHSRNHVPRLWDVNAGRALDTDFRPDEGSETERDAGQIFGIDLSPRGDRLAVAYKRGASFVFDISSGKVAWSANHGGRVFSVRFSPDGQRLATCGGPATGEDLHLWEAQSGRELVRWSVPAADELEQTERFGAVVSQLGYSGNGARLLTAGVNSPVCVWRLPSLPLPPGEEAIRHIAEQIIALGGGVGRVGLNGKMVWSVEDFPVGPLRIDTVVFGGRIATQVHDDDIPLLAELPDLEVVSFGQASVTDAAFATLAGIDTLKQINAVKVALSDKGLAELTRLTRLEMLELHHTDVTDEGLKRLGEMPALRFLTLGVSVKKKFGPAFLTDAGLAHLAAVDRLERLWLIGPTFTDDAVAHLAPLKRLRVLAVWTPNMSDAGIARLRESLPDCKIFDKRRDPAPEGEAEAELEAEVDE